MLRNANNVFGVQDLARGPVNEAVARVIIVAKIWEELGRPFAACISRLCLALSSSHAPHLANGVAPRCKPG